LTIDHSMQELAYKELGDRSGCVLAINPKTGAIIAMVSKPDFDPNEESLAENWNTLVEDDNHPFLARATSGLYAPGSTFKMLTALAAVENGYEDMVFEDNGSVTINGKIFENQKGKEYGEIGIKDGFAYSSNVVFGTLGFKLGGSKLFNVARRFGFNDVFDFDLEYMVSKFPQNINDDAQEAALAIGQGNMLATPLQMAMVTCGIANNGVVMKPYIVDRVVSKENRVVKKYKPTVLYEASDSLYTTKVVEMMVETVKNCKAKNLEKIKGVTIAGKTGTSENEKTDSDNNAQHTWFVSFAPAYDPEIVVVVMMEYSGGSGAGNCAPIARNIIKKYLKK
ncbi:MAG: peptidoglycan glycosyltransferase, partial [Clostridia bacterium]|nr:peptidoglycan glycosyltransferase [Clostridia bacterium]